MNKKIIISLIVGIAIILFIIGAYQRGWLGGTSGVYAAVFLDNNQVYFGKISGVGQFMTLRDIFYLQVNPSAQQPLNASRDLSLVKLGAELHGPTDEMKINRDHVLIVEELRDDSSVVQSIERYKKEQAAK